MTQINGGSLATDEMKENYEKDGWRYTPRGLDAQVENLNNYQDEVRKESVPTQEEKDQTIYKLLQRLQRDGIQMSETDKKFID